MDFNDTPGRSRVPRRGPRPAAANASTKRGGFETCQSRSTAASGYEGLERAKECQRKKADGGLAGCTGRRSTAGARAADPPGHLHAGGVALRRAARRFAIGLGMCVPTLIAYATEEQKRRYAPPRPARRGDLVPAVQRARRRLRPGRAAHARRARRRRLGHQRPEDLDLRRALRRLGHPRRPRTIPRRPSTRASPSSSLDMKSPGIETRPIKQISGGSHFNEVYFTDVRIPDAQRLGAVGAGLARGASPR